MSGTDDWWEAEPTIEEITEWLDTEYDPDDFDKFEEDDEE